MISVRSLTKRFGRAGTRNAVDGISFTIPDGKLFTLLGQSGCGKSTTLRMIAGIEEPTSGEISLGDRLVYSSESGVHVPVNDRPIGMVFQSYAIWPHMDVFDNVAFPLTVAKPRLARHDIEARTMTALKAVGLDALARRPATALSGGQQQRVALARALIREPEVLLLDEPLSNLDAKLREQMREEIRAIQQKIGITTVFVTHDQSEALAISDLILLMDEGRIVEFGDPQHLYDAPQTSYGARFIGVSNRFRGTFVGNGEIEFMETRVPHTGTEAFATGDALIVFLRPESIVLTRAPRNGGAWTGHIAQRTFQGDAWDYTVRVNGQEVRVRSHDKAEPFHAGDAAYLEPDYATMIVLPERATGRVRPSS